MRLAAAGLVLVAAAVAGCSGPSGGEGGADSTTARFCSALEEFRGSVDAADSDDIAAYVATLTDAAADVAAVGVPDDMPAEARRGFDLTIDRIEALADDATQDDVARLGDVTAEEQRSLDALEDYIDAACPAPSPSPGGSTSASPSGDS